MKRLVVSLFLITMGLAHAGSPKPDSVRATGRIVVVDLVDLADNQQRPEISEMLRRNLSALVRFTVLNRDTVAKRLTEFNINPRQPCNNPQCSFDIGSVLQAEYVIFGTATPLVSIRAVTLKLLHIPTAKIVWTKVLATEGTTDSDQIRNMDRRFVSAVHEFAKLSPDLDKNKHGSSLAIIDLSENSLQSRAFLERVCTRIYGNQRYDLMSPTELTELLTALEINKYSVVPSLENMIGLGQKLGVANLLYSRLYRDGSSFIYRLAMYDITNKSLVLELPPQPSEDLVKLLDYEKVFFNTLFSKEKAGVNQAANISEGKSNKALWISLGVLGIGGGIAAYWVENLGKPNGTKKVINSTFPLPIDPPTDPNK